MVPVLEAVPNFSEGRDLELIRGLVEVVAGEGAEVLDWSADPDHNRSVVTFVGAPPVVEAAALASARFAFEHIDMTRHRGVHPRVGALDVLPFVPLSGLTIQDASDSAHRVGEAIASLGVPVYFYGEASPRGRVLADLRRGGFEAIVDGFPPGREPDLEPSGPSRAHPTAGATCVGARSLLLAWNVDVVGIPLADVRRLAAELRERDGGFPALRALGLELPSRGRAQISMNLEDLDRTPPFTVFRHIEGRVAELGGQVVGTEVIGMIPDPLVLGAAADRLRLLDFHPSRLLSARLADHLSRRIAEPVRALLDAVHAAGDAVPTSVRDAADRVGTVSDRPGPE